MVYLGRVVGVGTLPNERMFIAYAVSGRSEPSRAGVARIVEDGHNTMVNIGPVDPDNLSQEQLAQKDLIFYDGMIVKRHPDEVNQALRHEWRSMFEVGTSVSVSGVQLSNLHLCLFNRRCRDVSCHRCKARDKTPL